MVIKIDLGFCVPAENGLLLELRSVGLVFVWVVEIDLVLCAGRTWLGFSAVIELSRVLCG